MSHLRMELQFAERFEGQAALVASVLVDVALRNGHLLPFRVNLAKVNLKTLSRFEVLIATFLPAEIPWDKKAEN